MVGLGRFELPTSRLSSARSNQLSYRPNSCKERSARRPALKAAIGQQVLQRRSSSVGSSEKKEKRRRRSPANGTRPDEPLAPVVYVWDPIETREAFLKDHP